MLTSFYVDTPAGEIAFSPSYFVGNKQLWTKRNLSNKKAPVETRKLRINATRKEVIAAFR